ncbi:hypothetical protein [Brevibacillus marinus]|uniref:hypothetical protein n=1 Tax=Brevibacillus marinus TaxID=2496837 RepID=UPI000F81CEC5|nr:hypothetical protein [Brevibacillus marinus]
MKWIGYLLLLIGIWMMVCPQANTGLSVLKWLSQYAFPGEAFLGAIVASLSFLFLNKRRETSEL